MGLFSKGKLVRMVWGMGLVCWLRLMVLCIWGNGKMGFIMKREFICILMGRGMRGRFSRGSKAGLVKCSTWMGISTKGNGVRTQGKGPAKLCMRMAVDILVSGGRINPMERAHIIMESGSWLRVFGMIEFLFRERSWLSNTKENGNSVVLMVKDSTNSKTDLSMMDNGEIAKKMA